jgi:hypothetical protein
MLARRGGRCVVDAEHGRTRAGVVAAEVGSGGARVATLGTGQERAWSRGAPAVVEEMKALLI